jgi:hypothetical protein
VDDIRAIVAMRIREFDPDGTLAPGELGKSLGIVLAPHFEDLYAADVQAFVSDWLTGVDMYSPADFVDALVKHFRLDEENGPCLTLT